MRRIVATMATLASLAVPAVAGAATTPLVPQFLGRPADFGGSRPALLVRLPGSIVYTGDGSGVLAGRGGSARHMGNLRWAVWTASHAWASGADWIDNCKPNCAQGHFRGYPVNVSLYRPGRLDRHLVFTRMTITYTGATPLRGYRGGTMTYRLAYKPGPLGYFWN